MECTYTRMLSNMVVCLSMHPTAKNCMAWVVAMCDVCQIQMHCIHARTRTDVTWLSRPLTVPSASPQIMRTVWPSVPSATFNLRPPWNSRPKSARNEFPLWGLRKRLIPSTTATPLLLEGASSVAVWCGNGGGGGGGNGVDGAIDFTCMLTVSIGGSILACNACSCTAVGAVAVTACHSLLLTR